MLLLSRLSTLYVAIVYLLQEGYGHGCGPNFGVVVALYLSNILPSVCSVESGVTWNDNELPTDHSV